MNIYDIAKAAGVSVATVSRVLNGSSSVKKTTRDKIMTEIEGSGYVPSAMARNLSMGESQTLAFIVPDIENSFFSQVLHGLTDKAMNCDYNVFMFGTDEKVEREHKILESLNGEMIKGIIIIPVAEEDAATREMLTRFEARGIPVVLLDRDMADGGFDGVFSEDATGSFQATECLIKEGHRRIAMVAGPASSRPGRERLAGYRKAIAEYGLAVEPAYIVEGNFRMEESYRAMETLMVLREPPTAIFTANNLATMGCLKYMKEHGLRLVRDISLVGFDDIPELNYTDTDLTVVTRPVYEMGCRAMELLEHRFSNGEKIGKSGEVVHRLLIKTHLIKRGSERYDGFRQK